MQKRSLPNTSIAIFILAVISFHSFAVPARSAGASPAFEAGQKPLAGTRCQFDTITGLPDPLLPLQPEDFNADGMAITGPNDSPNKQSRYVALDCDIETITGQPDPLPTNHQEALPSD